MVNLLESMHKCCLPSGLPSESASAYEKSLVHRIFGGRLRSQVHIVHSYIGTSDFLGIPISVVIIALLHIYVPGEMHKVLALFQHI